MAQYPPLSFLGRHVRAKSDQDVLSPNARIGQGFYDITHQGIEDRRGDPSNVFPASPSRYLDPTPFTGPSQSVEPQSFFPQDIMTPGKQTMQYGQVLGTQDQMNKIATQAAVDYVLGKLGLNR